MKNKIFLLLLLSGSLFSCGQPNANPENNSATDKNTAADQAVEITIDAKKYTFSQEDILTLAYIDKTHLGFSVLSEKNDLQLMFSAFLTELVPGTYQVADCKGPSNCGQEMDDKNQAAFFAPYPKDPMPALSLSRTAYDAPELSLQPLTLTITSVTDDQQPGVPFKTKRLKGQFSSTMAYVEKQDNGWKIVGKTTKVDGKFDMYCAIR